MKNYHIKFLLLGLMLCVFYCIGSWKVSLFDRDEPRFAQPAKEMLFAGNWQDWIVPHFNGEIFFHKPALCYWQIAGSYKIFGINAFAARFPSSFWMACAAVIIGIYLTHRFSYLTGLIGTLCFASSLIVIAEAKLATAEGLLVLLTIIAMLCLWDILVCPEISDENMPSKCKSQSWKKIVFWLALGLGIFCKGPAILISVAGTLAILFVFQKNIRQRIMSLGWLWGLPLALVIGLFWYVLANHLSDGALVERFWGYDIIERMRRPLESHRGFPGFYILTGLVDLFPWAVFLFPVAIFAWRNRNDEKIGKDIRFLISWLIGSTILLELIATKMIHYWLIVLPAYSLLLAIAFTDWIKSGEQVAETEQAKQTKQKTNIENYEIWMRWQGKAKSVLIAVWAIVALAGFLAGFVEPFNSVKIMLWAFSFSAIIAIVIAIIAFKKNSPANSFLAVVFGMLIISLTISAITLPALEKFKLSKQLADNMKRLADDEHTRFALIGWREPSTIFYLHNGTDNISIISPKEFAEFIKHPNTIIAVRAKYIDASFKNFVQKSYLSVGQLVGYDYTRGRRETIFVIKHAK